jgi:hypothetical protein
MKAWEAITPLGLDIYPQFTRHKIKTSAQIPSVFAQMLIKCKKLGGISEFFLKIPKCPI